MTAILQDVAPRTGRTRAVWAAVARTGRAVAAVAGALVSPHKAAVARLVEIPLTVVGVGCVDTAAWTVAAGLGWLVTGVSLFLLEHLIADPEPTQ